METEYEITQLENLITKEHTSNRSQRHDVFAQLGRLSFFGFLRARQENKYLDLQATQNLHTEDLGKFFTMMDEGFVPTSKQMKKVHDIIEHLFTYAETKRMAKIENSFRPETYVIYTTSKLQNIQAIEYGLQKGHLTLRDSEIYAFLLDKWHCSFSSSEWLGSELGQSYNDALYFSSRKGKTEHHLPHLGKVIHARFHDPKFCQGLFKHWKAGFAKQSGHWYDISPLLTEYPQMLFPHISKRDYFFINSKLMKAQLPNAVSSFKKMFEEHHNKYLIENKPLLIKNESVPMLNLGQMPESIKKELEEIKALYEKIIQQDQEKKVLVDYALIYKRALEQILTFRQIDPDLKLKSIQGKTPEQLLMETLHEAQSRLYEILVEMNETKVSQMSVNNRIMKGLK